MARKRLPQGFKRCGECGKVRRNEQFRTPHKGFGRCIFCWWHRWGMNDITLQAFGEEPLTPQEPPRPLSELGYTDDHDGVWIGEDGDLYEKARNGGPVKARPRMETPEHEERFALVLCRCCASAVFEQQRKWATFYCPPCQEEVVQFNDWCGHTVIPIGRHSIMWQDEGSSGRPAKGESTDDFAEGFAGALDGMVDAITHVDRHFEDELAMRLGKCGLASGREVRLREYLKRMAEADVATSCRAGFERLSSRLTDALLGEV